MRAVRSIFLLLLIVSCAPAALRRDAASSPAGQEVLQTQQRRFNAMVRNDLAELEGILAEDLSYTHTTGVSETKPAFLATLRSGALRYEQIEPDSVRVRVYGSTAVVTGRARMRVRSPAQTLAFAIRFTEVYVRGEGRWRLAAWQSTRLP